VLEGRPATEKTRLHLDRCLTCRSCETTCPSGVEYGRLADIGRHVVEQQVPRTGADRLKRIALREFVPRSGLFGTAMGVGRLLRPLLPRVLAEQVPHSSQAGRWPVRRHARRMIVLAGCVQPAMRPSINAATARVLDLLGISLVEQPAAGCCGALKFHLQDQEGGRDDARRNIDAWWPGIAAGEVEAIVVTASGCGVQVKDYGHLLKGDPAYAAKAARVAALSRDVAEVVLAEAPALQAILATKAAGRPTRKIAFHAPCSLQHGLKIRGVVEGLLMAAGFELVPVRDTHLCCGSAGTYSLLQPALSHQLRDNKLAALQEGRGERIASANIGCIEHLCTTAVIPVQHWIELIDEKITESP
jgi:glycolate oxidase iron-sulfur subunit